MLVLPSLPPATVAMAPSVEEVTELALPLCEAKEFWTALPDGKELAVLFE